MKIINLSRTSRLKALKKCEFEFKATFAVNYA